MTSKIITVKRINHIKKMDFDTSFFVMDADGECYHYPANLFRFNPTTEVLALTKEGDKLEITFASTGVENKISEATFKEYVD